MADIKVRIEVNPNAESELLGDVKNDNAETSNVSLKTNNSNIFENIPTSESSGTNEISFAQDLVFNSEGYVDNVDLQGGVIGSEQNPTEFVWGVVPPSKEYSVKLTFTNAQNLKDIIVYGNKTTNQFPTRVIVDGTTEIFSDDYRWAINLKTESDTHTIEFTHWNRTNYNACLTFISVMMKYFEIDKRNGLKSVESLSQSTGQPKEIFYGVVPSTGLLEIIDVNGEIADMIRDNIIPNSNVKVDIFANNKQVQNHLSTDSIYSVNNKTFTADLNNQLYKWDGIDFIGRNANGKASVYDILKDLFGADVDNMLNLPLVYGNNITGNVKDYVEKIFVDYPYIAKCKFSDAVNKICTVAQLNIIEDDSGNIKFVSSRPIISSSHNIISIPSKNTINVPVRDFILKNKYGYVEVNENQFNRTINVRQPVYNILGYENLENSLVSLTNTTSTLSNNTTTTSNPAVRYIETSFGSETTFWGVLTYLEGIYCRFKIDIPKKSNYNLTQITAINTNNENIEAQSTYKIYTANATSNTRYPSIDNFTISEYVDTGIEQTNSISKQFSYKSWDTVNGETLGVDMVLPTSNQYVKIISENEDIYTLEISVLVGRKELSSVDSGNPSSLEWNGTIRYLKPVRFDMSIYGNNYEITFDENLIPSGNSDAIYSVSVSSNELLQDGTKFNGEKLSEIIGKNIIEDYKDGIHTATTTCVCGDYYDINGNRAKDWSKGEILQVGDIVRVDKDNNGNSAMKYADGSDMYFRVTGRTFRYAGVPLVDLELQEVRAVN